MTGSFPLFTPVSRLNLTMTSAINIICFFALLYLLWRLLFNKSTARPSLPPGPRRSPIIGNFFQAPSSREWETYAKWGQEYGDIMSITILGKNIIILNSAEMAEEMLDAKGFNYSEREIPPMVRLSGWEDAVTFTSTGKSFRKQRALMHRLMGTSAALGRFKSLIEDESRFLIQRVLDNPDGLADHAHHYAGSIVLRISYGYTSKEHEDPFLFLAKRAIEELFVAATPATWAVDFLPLLEKLPDWFPGTNFKKIGRKFSDHVKDLLDAPYNFVREQMTTGTYTPSFTSTLIETTSDLTLEEEYLIKWVSMVVYAAGYDTIVTFIRSFFLAMAIYPEVFQMAQAEVDLVVGDNRLPLLSDRDNLPYIDAVVLEVFRWNPALASGIPHKSANDDIHAGYFIPKGSIVIANLYSMLRDDRLYQNPERFNPGRFLGENPEKDPRQIVFGYGRRICPGRHLADQSLFIVVARVLAVLNIGKKIKNGVIVEPAHRTQPGFVSHPAPYEIEVRPRSTRAELLVRASDNA